MHYEYRVVPAPTKGEKARGVKSTADRFALALTGAMNKMAREGWEYLRADVLPCEERVGLTGTKSTFQHLLVFRRPVAEVADIPAGMPVPLALTAEAAVPRLGPATASEEGAAPALGPATPPGTASSPSLAAE